MKKNISLLCLTFLIMSCLFRDNAERKQSGDVKWKHDSTTHFKLHALNTVPARDSLQAIGQKVESIQYELLSVLQESELQYLELYFLKDRETLTSYTGFPANAYTNTAKGIIYFVDNSTFNLAYRHEIMHALSWRLWGSPKGYWLSEGIAVFASQNCGGYNVHTLAHAISKQDKIVAFYTLVNTFDFRLIEPSLQSASLVKYIYDNYGIRTLKSMWQNGLQHAKELTGISAFELEKRWKEYIDQKRFEAIIDWDKIKQRGCE